MSPLKCIAASFQEHLKRLCSDRGAKRTDHSDWTKIKSQEITPRS